MSHDARCQELSLTDSLATTPAISLGHAINGSIRILADETATSLTYHVCDTATGTYYPARDASGTVINQTSLAHTNNYQLPATIFGNKFIKIIVDNDSDVVLCTQS